MNNAAEKPDRDPTDIWLDQFRDQHSVLLRRAQEAADTTQTPGWQSNYKVQRTLHDRSEAEGISTIDRELASMRLQGTSEESEKAIKDAVKAMGEERIRFRAWEARAVENYRKSASELRNYIETILRKARDNERDQPLIHRGYGDIVRDALKSWATAEWNEDLGQVVIV